MTWDEIESELVAIVDEFANDPRAVHLKIARELARVGEYGVALDSLCSQLYEYEIPVSRRIYQRIEQLGNAMKMEPSAWMLLAELFGAE